MILSQAQVEMLIKDAIAEGAFDNLKGAGKPLEINPQVDVMQEKLRALGFMPREVTLRIKLAGLEDIPANREAREQLKVEIDILMQSRLQRS
jgi:hypothetical protein